MSNNSLPLNTLKTQKNTLTSNEHREKIKSYLPLRTLNSLNNNIATENTEFTEKGFINLFNINSVPSVISVAKSYLPLRTLNSLKKYFNISPSVPSVISVAKYILFSLCLCASVVCCGFAVSALAQNDAIQNHYKKGRQYYEQGRYKEAKEEFQKALELTRSQQKQEAVEIAETKTEAGQWEYTIGDEDVLEISVWEWPDLSKDVMVRPDGKLSFPLIGDIPVRGLTLPQLDATITKELTNFVKNPQVSIAVKKLGGYKIIMLGEVKAPGVYRLEQKGSGFLEAIALAGGFTRDAVPRSVAIIRGGDIKNPDVILVDATKIFKTGDISRNMTLESKDIVYVPRRFISDVNYFLTQMVGPITTAAFTTTAITAAERGR